jgi:hypothetical protein
MARVEGLSNMYTNDFVFRKALPISDGISGSKKGSFSLSTSGMIPD